MTEREDTGIAEPVIATLVYNHKERTVRVERPGIAEEPGSDVLEAKEVLRQAAHGATTVEAEHWRTQAASMARALLLRVRSEGGGENGGGK